MMRNEERSETRYRIINDIYQEEAAKRAGRVYYLDVYERFRDENGSYTDFIDGVQVRTPDGIHFSREGGDQIAQAVIDTLNEAYDLTSWRSERPRTAPTTTPTGPATTLGTTA
jgi:hypothetical protein